MAAPTDSPLVMLCVHCLAHSRGAMLVVERCPDTAADAWAMVDPGAPALATCGSADCAAHADIHGCIVVRGDAVRLTMFATIAFYFWNTTWKPRRYAACMALHGASDTAIGVAKAGLRAWYRAA